MADEVHVLTMDNTSLIPELNGRTLTRYWLVYKVLMVELCVDHSRTVGDIDYNG